MLLFFTGLVLFSLFLYVYLTGASTSLRLSMMIGFFIRLLFIFLASPQSNYDLQSYGIVGSMTAQHLSIYPEVALNHFPYLPLFLYIEAFTSIAKPFDILLLKLIIITFDTGIIYLIYKLSRKKITALVYALCPVSILISSVQGQFDAIPLFFLLIALFYIVKKRVALAGLLYSLAIALKTWPVFLIILTLRQLRGKGAWTKRGTFLFLSVFISSFALVFYSIAFKTPLAEIIFVIRTYQPVFGVYGVGFLLKTFFQRTDLYLIGMSIKIFLMALLAYSLLQKNKDLLSGCLGVLLFFFVFTPVFGIQWLVWSVPFLLILKPRGALLLIVTMSFFLLLNYLNWEVVIDRNILLGSDLVVWAGFVYVFIAYTLPISVSSNVPSASKTAR